MNRHLKRFKQALGLGIVLNAIMILGLFFAPTMLMELLGIPPPNPIWVRTIGLLMCWISVAYLPALKDPARYRQAAWYTIGVRVSGIIFFGGAVLLGSPMGFIVFALYDATFVILQGVPLYLGLHHGGLETGAPGGVAYPKT